MTKASRSALFSLGSCYSSFRRFLGIHLFSGEERLDTSEPRLVGRYGKVTTKNTVLLRQYL